MIHIYSIEGKKIKTISCHTGKVLDLCLLQDASYLASCSEDGSTFIVDMQAATWKEIKTKVVNPMGETATCVSLSPQYASKKRIALGFEGAGAFTLSEKSFKGDKIRALNPMANSCSLIRWSPLDALCANNPPGFVSFISKDHCFIYSYIEKRIVFELNRSSGRVSMTMEEDRPEVNKCSMIWENPYRLLIVWGDVLQAIDVAVLGYYGATKLSQNDLPILECKISASFRVKDYDLLSAFSFKTYFVILALSRTSSSVQIMLTNRKGDITCIRQLEVDMNIQDENLYGYDLVPITGSEKFFVRCPDQILCFSIIDADLAIDNLFAEMKIGDAVYKSMRHKEALTKHNTDNLIDEYLKHLFSNSEFRTAASFCSRYLPRKKERWNFWVKRFLETNQINHILDYIPYKKPKLSRSVYTDVLLYLIDLDSDRFMRSIERWPSEVYKASKIIEEVEKRLLANYTPIMLEALTKIYIKEGKSTFELEKYSQLKLVMTSAAEITQNALLKANSPELLRTRSKSPSMRNMTVPPQDLMKQ